MQHKGFGITGRIVREFGNERGDVHVVQCCGPCTGRWTGDCTCQTTIGKATKDELLNDAWLHLADVWFGGRFDVLSE